MAFCFGTAFCASQTHLNGGLYVICMGRRLLSSLPWKPGDKDRRRGQRKPVGFVLDPKTKKRIPIFKRAGPVFIGDTREPVASFSQWAVKDTGAQLSVPKRTKNTYPESTIKVLNGLRFRPVMHIFPTIVVGPKTAQRIMRGGRHRIVAYYTPAGEYHYSPASKWVLFSAKPEKAALIQLRRYSDYRAW
jgi:hypothetical protein